MRTYRSMKISPKVLATTTLLLFAAFVFTYFQSHKSINKSTEVFVWDCVSPEYKPKSITLTCADGGWSIQAITWSSWSAQGASGNGIWRENLCQPNCAKGKFTEVRVKIKLTGLTPFKGKFYLRTIDITTNNGKDFPEKKSEALNWDLMDFLEPDQISQ